MRLRRETRWFWISINRIFWNTSKI